jgi:hypothetical protein
MRMSVIVRAGHGGTFVRMTRPGTVQKIAITSQTAEELIVDTAIVWPKQTAKEHDHGKHGRQG